MSEKSKFSFKSLLFKEQEETTQTTQAPKLNQSASEINLDNLLRGNSNAPKAAQASSIDANDPFIKNFEKLMDEANLPGPDYYEFMKSLFNLSAHIKDDASLYASSFAALQTMGLTKENLVRTAKQYIGIINEDEKLFTNALQAKQGKDIDERKKQLLDIESLKKEKAEMVAKLNSEIADLEKTSSSTVLEINEASSSLENAKGKYSLAKSLFVNKINSDIEKINSLINN